MTNTTNPQRKATNEADIMAERMLAAARLDGLEGHQAMNAIVIEKLRALGFGRAMDIFAAFHKRYE